VIQEVTIDNPDQSLMTELCVAVPTTAVEMTNKRWSRTVSTGVLAFFVGMLLSLAAWISNQGWAVCSILIFGSDLLAGMWKHTVFVIAGSLVLAVAWCLSFKYFFPGNDEVADSLQDLGEVGFFFGYIIAEYLGIGLFESNDFDKYLPLFLVVWALLKHLKIYLKAVKRVETADFLICEAERV
jgi:hypothetical protein